jgi:hypothetical protein
MWNGTAESVVNLNPAGYFESEAKDISGNSQVGWGDDGSGLRALLWHGTAESVVDLHPATGYNHTEAHFVAGDSQLGVGFTTEGSTHVLLWHGTAESMVDLHPAGFVDSIPFVGSGLDESGDYQIGIGLLGEPGEFVSHALLWQGTAESVVDLHAYLEGDFTESLPLVVYPDGSVMGSATEQVGEFELRSHTVLWTPLAAGDFDESGTLDLADIHLLTEQIQSNDLDLEFDLNDDSLVTSDDLKTWVKDLRETWIGDANLDGEFNSGDLVAVFEVGEYEDAIQENSGWAEGDWDADGDFTSGDLVLAFQDGGYMAAAVPAVPEPTSVVMLLAGLIGLAIVSNTRRKAV